MIASWLISTIIGDLLPAFTGSTTTSQIRSKVSHLFAAASEAKVVWLQHELHLVAKGNLSVTEYLARVKKMCDVLEVSSHGVS